MLSHVSRQQVEQDPLVVQLDLLHVVSLLFGLGGESHIRGEVQPFSVIARIAH